MIVVKVGGSLYDHPALGPGLRQFVESLGPVDVLLVPGGGSVADAVRELDRVHGLGEEAAHWTALRALSATAAFLERIAEEPTPNPSLKGGEQDIRNAGAPGRSQEAYRAFTPSLKGGGWGVGCLSSSPLPSGRGAGGVGSSCRVLDCFAFAQEDEVRPGALPHTWSVTTDSIAARAALVFRAERLVLLKSTDVPAGTSWDTAAANGWVDAHFPQIASALNCPVEIINFRGRLGARA